jgi:predicted RNA-binding protein with PUA-like domain
MPAKQYWLVKSEPDVFSYDDLTKAPKKTTFWDGVRNFTARNNLKAMKKGDLVFFYHSNANPSAVVGVTEVVKEASPDPSALDPKDDHFDPKSDPASPTWFGVELKAHEKLNRPVPLDEIKKTKGLDKMALVRLGRLSVSPVTPEEWEIIYNLGKKKG